MDMRGIEQIATDEGCARHGAGGAADEVSARGHVVLPFCRRARPDCPVEPALVRSIG
jgi:hypothetical protein